MKIEMDIGPNVIRSYKRLSYRAWFALAEFLDNSTQSFFDHREELDKSAGGKAALEIDIAYDKNLLRIHDTAMGMSEAELRHALRIGYPPANANGRSEFGMGLKTAACWFGDLWTVRTKKLGEPYEYEVTVDVEAIANGNLDLNAKPHKKPLDLHYTTIEIRKLHRSLHPATVRRIEMHLRSMFRQDIRDGVLLVRIMGKAPLTWDGDLKFLKDPEGTPYHKDFEDVVNGKKVRGWMGVLEGGGRTKSGLAQIRRGRVIRGQPDAWRPEAIYGLDRNDLINQRLVGEIHLDAFGISHTKDEILWQEEEEEELEKLLKKKFGDYIAISRKTYRSIKGDGAGPTDVVVKAAVDELKERMKSPDFADAIEIQEIPPEKVLKEVTKHITERSQKQVPEMTVAIGDNACRVYLSRELSPMDPYFVSDTAKDIVVTINCNHAHWRRIRGADAVMAYLKECVYDAVAEWMCAKKQGVIRHDSIKYFKDSLLRLELTHGDAIADDEESSDAIAEDDDSGE